MIISFYIGGIEGDERFTLLRETWMSNKGLRSWSEASSTNPCFSQVGRRN